MSAEIMQSGEHIKESTANKTEETMKNIAVTIRLVDSEMDVDEKQIKVYILHIILQFMHSVKNCFIIKLLHLWPS